ncbi:hypothetical protein Leryth_014111 [Lithospermum erythrorhizon]|nr:hypothetical protein Leryth_014111 [Lithospermum erythrorhizon]
MILDSIYSDKALAKSSDGQASSVVEPQPNDSAGDGSSKISAAKTLVSSTLVSSQDDSMPGNSGKSAFARLTSGIGLPPATGFIGTLTKGIVDSSKNAVKLSESNKRRYQVMLVYFTVVLFSRSSSPKDI